MSQRPTLSTNKHTLLSASQPVQQKKRTLCIVLLVASCGGLLPPVEYGCAEEDFTPETSRRDGVTPRFGLGPASTGRVLLCGGGFTTAGACFPPVLVLLLRRPAPTCHVLRCRVLLC
ncbi:hypothetical protein NQZ68_007638 [Dissostichus eleginoides]|nr:hypothetical protein NQZ68_007638 [Dissostichus eleginoides]